MVISCPGPQLFKEQIQCSWFKPQCPVVQWSSFSCQTFYQRDSDLSTLWATWAWIFSHVLLGLVVLPTIHSYCFKLYVVFKPINTRYKFAVVIIPPWTLNISPLNKQLQILVIKSLRYHTLNSLLTGNRGSAVFFAA